MALLVSPAPPAPAYASSLETGTVTMEGLALREGPGLDFQIIHELPQGTQLTLIDFTEGWYYAQYGHETGFVSARYVRVSLPDGYSQADNEQSTVVITIPDSAEVPALDLPDGIADAGASPDSAAGRPVLDFTAENNPQYPYVMLPGDMGNSVIDLQVTLQHMGYDVPSDGCYGDATQAALTNVQRLLNIDADGLVGPQTRRIIGVTSESHVSGEVELLDWWLGGNVAIARLCEAAVVDVRTGKRFRIFRYGGDKHCDAEPLTTADAAILREIAGGEWTWDRRPIWVEAGGRVIAASMHCMPHEGQHVGGNDFDGHFCIHLKGSHTHGTDRVDEAHAACVMEAWEARARYV
ncbi:SH3 domain-containing protein, partial [Eubacteriales bacterium OttesenSCG-928-A19]|nr:SH3 domain-containing protein [Eubacteriales bacterium OttesenSCG-928-A19]